MIAANREEGENGRRIDAFGFITFKFAELQCQLYQNSVSGVVVLRNR